MYSLQTTVTVEDKTFSIRNNGDYRMVLDCFSALADEELSEDYRVLASLLIFYNEFNSLDDALYYKAYMPKLIEEMYKFFNCGQSESAGHNVNMKVIDWDEDEQMICAAVNVVAQAEVRSIDYLHWWTFMGYYMSVGESVLSTVVSIRYKILKHEKLEKWEQKFKKENPRYFMWKSKSVGEREAENLIRELWNRDGD